MAGGWPQKPAALSASSIAGEAQDDIGTWEWRQQDQDQGVTFELWDRAVGITHIVDNQVICLNMPDSRAGELLAAPQGCHPPGCSSPSLQQQARME